MLKRQRQLRLQQHSAPTATSASVHGLLRQATARHLVQIDLAGLSPGTLGGGCLDGRVLAACRQLRLLACVDCGLTRVRHWAEFPASLVYLDLSLNRLTGLLLLGMSGMNGSEQVFGDWDKRDQVGDLDKKNQDKNQDKKNQDKKNQDKKNQDKKNQDKNQDKKNQDGNHDKRNQDKGNLVQDWNHDLDFGDLDPDQQRIILPQLRFLAVHGNQLADVESVRRTVQQLTSLRHLLLTHNLSGRTRRTADDGVDLPMLLPEELWNPICVQYHRASMHDHNDGMGKGNHGTANMSSSGTGGGLSALRESMFACHRMLRSVDGVDRLGRVLDDDVWLNERLAVRKLVERMEEQERDDDAEKQQHEFNDDDNDILVSRDVHPSGASGQQYTEQPRRSGIEMSVQTAAWMCDRATSPIPVDMSGTRMATMGVQTDLCAIDVMDRSTTVVDHGDYDEKDSREKMQCLQSLLDQQLVTNNELQGKYRQQTAVMDRVRTQHAELAAAYERLMAESTVHRETIEKLEEEKQRRSVELNVLNDKSAEERRLFERTLAQKDKEYGLRRKEWARERERWEADRGKWLDAERALLDKIAQGDVHAKRVGDMEAELSVVRRELNECRAAKTAVEDKYKWERRQWRALLHNMKSGDNAAVGNHGKKTVAETEAADRDSARLQQMYEQSLKTATEHHLAQQQAMTRQCEQLREGYLALERVLEEQCGAYQTKIEAMEAELRRAREEASKLKEGGRLSEIRESKLRTVVGELTQVVEEQRGQLSKLRTDWAKDRQESREWIERLQKKIDETDPAHLMHLQRLQKTEQERYQTEEVKWRQQRREFELKVEQLESKIREWEERCDLLSRSGAERERTFNEQRQSLEQSVKIKERMVDAAEHSVKEWKTKFEEVRDKLEKLEKGAGKERQELLRELKNVEQLNDALNQQRVEMEDDLAAAIQSESKLKQKLLRTEQALEERETMMAMIEKEVVQMKDRVKQQQEERDLQYRQIELDLENMQAKLTEQEEACRSLEKERDALVAEKKEMSEEMRAVLSYIDALGQKQGQLEQIRHLLLQSTDLDAEA